jgi:hypothetical protein
LALAYKVETFSTFRTFTFSHTFSHMDQTPLPQGWIAQFDQNSGRYYFVNTTTNQTTWDDPRMAQGAAYGQPSQPGFSMPSSDPYGQPQAYGGMPGESTGYQQPIVPNPNDPNVQAGGEGGERGLGKVLLGAGGIAVGAKILSGMNKKNHHQQPQYHGGGHPQQGGYYPPQQGGYYAPPQKQSGGMGMGTGVLAGLGGLAAGAMLGKKMGGHGHGHHGYKYKGYK